MAPIKIDCEICGRESENYIKLRGVEGKSGVKEKYFCSQHCSVEFIVSGGEDN
ncbi:MAG: hypothetical protein KC646_06835 [Candidatus Cloacimonetes bacterium]|nr:hypothetical protein [Candidatus Cloacimonadota bacterium]